MASPRFQIHRALGPAVAFLLAAKGAFSATPVSSGAIEVRRAEGADDCPDAEAFAARVERQLGRRALLPGPTPDAPTIFEVWLWREGRIRRARLVARGQGAGQRELVDQGEGCEGLAEAIATTTAIALSDGAPPAGPVTPDAPSPPVGLAFEAGLDVALRVLDSAAPAGRALVELKPLPWLGLGLGALATPSSRFESGPGSAEISLLAAELRACGHWPGRRPIDFGLCVSSLAGAMRAKGRGYSPDREATGAWVALAVGPKVGGKIYGPLGWTAHASALVPIWSDRFTVDSLGVVYDPPPVGALIGAGLSMTIR